MASYYTVPIGQPLNDVPVETGSDVKNGDSIAISGQVKTNKKQVSFNRHDKLVVMDDDSNDTPASSLWNSARSADSNMSKDSGGPISPTSSVRSFDSSGNTTVSIPSLLSSLMRTHKHRDPYRYYEVLKVLGDGSMGSVSKVRKRKSAIGGSARKAFVEEESQHYQQDQKTLLHNCFSFCIPGSKEKKKENSFASIEEIDRERSSGSTGSVLTSDSSYIYGVKTGNCASHNTSSEQEQIKTSIQSSSSMISFSGESSAVYALKTIILDKVTDSTFRRELLNEVDILRSISHPNIVKALDFYSYKNRLYLVLELCSGGDLYVRDPYDESHAKSITYMILDAVAYLHSKNLVHRDLKYENVCFSSPTSPYIKIIDFGLSKKYMKNAMHETVGTVYTMAPEVIKGDYNEACDVWSIGVMAFMLLSSSLPFYGKSRANVVKKILQHKYGFKAKKWKTVSQESMNFVKSLLVPDIALRPTAAQAMKDPWFEKEFGAHNYETIISSAVMDRVQASIEAFAGYSRFKKLALMVIAHKSTDEEIGFLRRLFLRRFAVEKSSPDISYPEFKEALANYNYTEEDLVRMFVGMDIDGSGKVNYTEFLAATIEAHGSIEEERIAEAFDRLDDDDSGYVTVENLRSFLGDSVSDAYINDIIDEVDIVRDHRVSYEEFLSMWDETDDEILKKTLKEVESKRTRRETVFALEKNVHFEEIYSESFDTDSSDAGAALEGFAKEKEKSLRGVWV